MQDFLDNPSEQVLKYWNKYRYSIILSLLVTVLGLSVHHYYTEQQRNISIAAAEHYYNYTDAVQRDDLATQQRSLSILKTETPHEAFTSIALLREVAHLIESKNFEQAELTLKEVEKITQIETLRTLASYKRAEIYYAQQRFDEASALLSEIQRPDFILKDHLQARIYAATGRTKEALAIFEKLLALPQLEKPVQALWSAQYQALALQEELS